MFSVLGSMVSKNIVNWVTNWKIPKIYRNSLGHDKINLDVWPLRHHFEPENVACSWYQVMIRKIVTVKQMGLLPESGWTRPSEGRNYKLFFVSDRGESNIADHTEGWVCPLCPYPILLILILFFLFLFTLFSKKYS